MHISLESIYTGLLTLGRVGAAVSFLPGFGEAFVPPQVRIFLAVTLALCLTPVVDALMPAPDPGNFLSHLLAEICVGGMIGLLIRLFTLTLELAGTIISFQMGLSAAMAFNPALSQQGSLISSLLMMAGLVLVFSLNIHHVFLAGLVKSYDLFPLGDFPDISAAGTALIDLLTRSFLVAVQVSAPFLVIQLLFVFGVGLINRLMPQLQLFFVTMPVQIFIGMILFALTVTGILTWYLDAFQEALVSIFESL